MRTVLVCLFLLFSAQTAHAAVSISEVAWMGTAVSANDEWIELHNNGTQAIAVDGWQLTDEANFNITLAGSLPSGAYGVLERTDDASAPGSALMIYTGSLTNAGATLSLYDAGGSLIDRVAGGENWESIGGDNISKETAQYSTSGWITAPATPGAAPSQQAVGIVDDSEDEADKDVRTSTAKGEQTLHLTPRELTVQIEGPARVYENQEVAFIAHTTGVAQSIQNSVEHIWNFGDMTVATGSEVAHHFVHPGEYVVTVHSGYKAYEAAARMEVVVLPTRLSLSRNSFGDIQIHNDAKYEIDISQYTITGLHSVKIPEGTILLPGATIVLPKERVQADDSVYTMLIDERGVLVAHYNTRPVGISVSDKTIAQKAPVAAVHTVTTAPLVRNVAMDTKTPPFAFASDLFVPAPESDQLRATATQAAAVLEAVPDVPQQTWPYMALFGVIALGLLTVFAGRVKG